MRRSMRDWATGGVRVSGRESKEEWKNRNNQTLDLQYSHFFLRPPSAVVYLILICSILITSGTYGINIFLYFFFWFIESRWNWHRKIWIHHMAQSIEATRTVFFLRIISIQQWNLRATCSWTSSFCRQYFIFALRASRALASVILSAPFLMIISFPSVEYFYNFLLCFLLLHLLHR